MSHDVKNVEEIFKRLNDHYPYSYAILRQIAINFGKIYTEVNPEPIKIGETKNISLGIDMDTNGVPRLSMGENATIFYTSVVYTLMEMITQIMLPDKNFEDIEKDFVLNNKVCPNPNCGEVNNISDESCLKCGTKLH